MLDETSPPRSRRHQPKQGGLNRTGLGSARLSPPPARERSRLAPRDQRREPAVVVPIGLAALFLVAAGLLALAVGRYSVPLGHVVEILASRLAPVPNEASGTEQNVVLLVRMPRILLAALVGGGLALGGAALQAVFRNPLVSPEIIGVSAGASFGGALALLLGLESALLVAGSFAFGLIALAILFLITSGRGGTPMLMVVLGGVVTGSFFSALVALVTYVADPDTTLPAIVFWLLGSVATATFTKVLVAVIPILGGAVVLLALRWRINVLSLGDDDAAALGVRPRPLRWVVLLAVALIVAGAVAVSGAVSWVGLVIPHLARMWVGPDHRVLLPVSFLLGAAYIVLVDTVARTATAGEIPLGVLTALIGAPVFFLLLRRNRERIWESA
ncbi:FecCD family ABC transporter permease [Arthrobacter bambusae]|uniref:FecCD family ABC transporter permease n=1 Tax=Arthrobacter bambusae TaxID=1338426 RepID=UPI0027851C14|nr:iron ABC transporter permease [Arthrobacter bambusae]MDQ0213134.1 iron complex transport system permease protein [Arthrobacter bambusae]MDQ0237416.1 iron complex transport system permease protein [Arthrobacter bambusae]